MRILAYADSLAYSGAEYAFVEVVEQLSRGSEFDVSAAVPAGLLAEELARRDVAPVLELPRVKLGAGLRYGVDVRLGRAVRRAARLSRADAVLVNLPSAQAGWWGMAAGLPSVAFLHIPHSLARSGFVMGGIRDRIARPRLRRASRVVVPAPSTMHYLWDVWGIPPERVTWAPPPSRDPLAVPRREARSMLDLPPDRRLIGIVGRVSIKQKGHDVLLRAFARLAAHHGDVDLVVAGGGPDLAALRELARSLRIADRIRLLGPVPRPDDFLSAIDLIAIPSRFEGLPLVALEALKAATPGVASAVDGLADVWPPGWLVPPGAPERLAAALEELLRTDRPALESIVQDHWLEVAGEFGGGQAAIFGAALRQAAQRAS